MGLAKLMLQEELKRDSLLKMLRKLLSEGFQEKAKQFQNKITQYNGLETAVKIIQETA